MRPLPNATIDFRIGNERYAQRAWNHVPRVGDCLLLGAGKDRFKSDHNGDALFQVKQVTWGAENSLDKAAEVQRVIVHIEHVADD